MVFDRDYYINLPVPIERELDILFCKDEALTILEIGACEGEDSIRYSNLFPKSHIYAFEPLPQNLERINDNIKNYKKEILRLYQWH